MNTVNLYTWMSLTVLLFIGCKKEDKGSINDFFYLRNDGADMPVNAEGNLSSNKCIIVVHGGPGGNAKIYDTAIPQVSNVIEKECLMVYWDQRGSGTAKGNYDASSVTIAQYVDDLDKLITLIRYKYGQGLNIYLMGHSWGGGLTAAYLTTSTQQQRVSGWIDVDGAHNLTDHKVFRDALYKISNERVLAGSKQKEWKTIRDFCASLYTPLSDKDLSQLNKYGFRAEQLLGKDKILSGELPEGYLNYAFNSGHDPLTSFVNMVSTNSNLFDEYKRVNYKEELSTVTIPCLFLWGKHDYVVPVEFGKEAFNSVSSSDKELYIFDNAGHSPMLYDASSFNRLVLNFIKNH